MSETLQVYVTDTHARVPNGLGGYKSISLLDFGKELIRIAEDQEETSIGTAIRFPNEMVSMRFSSSKIDMLLYFPSRKVTLKYHDRNIKEYPGCIVPNVLIKVEMTKMEGPEGIRWSMGEVKWWTTDLSSPEIPPYQSLQEGIFSGRIFAVPLPNQYGNGGMCVGHNSFRTSYENNWVAMNELYWHVLIGSPFNGDLSLNLKANSRYSNPQYFEFLQTQDEFTYGVIRNHPGPDLFSSYLNNLRNPDAEPIPF